MEWKKEQESLAAAKDRLVCQLDELQKFNEDLEADITKLQQHQPTAEGEQSLYLSDELHTCSHHSGSGTTQTAHLPPQRKMMRMMMIMMKGAVKL